MKQYKEIPSQLDHPLFASLQSELFPDEMQHYLEGNMDGHPWQQSDPFMKALLFRWQQLNAELEQRFLIEKNAKKNEMAEGIAIFLRLLFWTNQEPVNVQLLTEKLAIFKIKPANIQDRMQFILARPISFHAFKQLQLLMLEQQKQFAVKLTIQKSPGR